MSPKQISNALKQKSPFKEEGIKMMNKESRINEKPGIEMNVNSSSERK